MRAFRARRCPSAAACDLARRPPSRALPAWRGGAASARSAAIDRASASKRHSRRASSLAILAARSSIDVSTCCEPAGMERAEGPIPLLPPFRRSAFRIYAIRAARDRGHALDPPSHNPLHLYKPRTTTEPQRRKDSGDQHSEVRIQHPEALNNERAGPHNPKTPDDAPAEREVPATGAAAQLFYIILIVIISKQY